MSLTCGIVGLPNVGKSTLFNALTSSGVDSANFPFCTIDPNVGIVKVPDYRLWDIAKAVGPEKVIPTTVSFTDIAGLVEGASKGEGLGNQFLGHIKSTQAIVHVVRCFEDENVTHVNDTVDPVRDIEIIETELMLADLATVTKRFSTLEKQRRVNPKSVVGFEALEKVKVGLESGTLVRNLELTDEDRSGLADLHLLTEKPMLYVANVSEDDLLDPEANPHVNNLTAKVSKENVLVICSKIEAEISQLPDEEKSSFLESMGLPESGLDRLVKTTYRLLKLMTYFTAGKKEVRAWTVRDGAKAPEAAGVIHTDFEKGFIKAEVFHYEELMKHGSEAEIKANGLLRIEGKEYDVRDGDVMHFRFNV